MKKHMRISALALALSILLNGVAFAAPTANIPDNPEKTTVEEVTASQVMDKNYGTVTKNNGTINDSQGVVGENNGTIESVAEHDMDGNGTVGVNNGKITKSEGYIETNNGTIAENDGVLITNNEIEGAVSANITENSGYVGTNNGWIEENGDEEGFGSVETNAGKITKNTGSVVTNNGEITTNAKEGKNNVGSVWTNDGKIIVSDGNVLSNGASGYIGEFNGAMLGNGGLIDLVGEKASMLSNYGVIKDNKGTISFNMSTIGSNEGTILLNNGDIEKNNGYIMANDFSGIVYNTGADAKVELNLGTVWNAKKEADGSLSYDAQGGYYYGIIYDDGTGDEDNALFDNFAEGTVISVLTGFTKSGYDFVKWLCKDPDGNKQYYRGGESISVLSPLWFTALWTEHWEDIAPTVTGTADAPVSGGRWFKNPSGQWFYMTSGTFRNCWGYIENPSAKNEKDRYGWFRFDRNGVMLTGWQEIDGTWYYFSTDTTDGTYGMCLLDTTTPDGYKVDTTGAWIG